MSLGTKRVGHPALGVCTTAAAPACHEATVDEPGVNSTFFLSAEGTPPSGDLETLFFEYRLPFFFNLLLSTKKMIEMMTTEAKTPQQATSPCRRGPLTPLTNQKEWEKSEERSSRAR